MYSISITCVYFIKDDVVPTNQNSTYQTKGLIYSGSVEMTAENRDIPCYGNATIVCNLLRLYSVSESYAVQKNCTSKLKANNLYYYFT